MAAPKTSTASKLRTVITTFLSKLPESERAEALAQVAEAVIDADGILTEAQEKNSQRQQRAEAKAARDASIPVELREPRPIATLKKAVKNVKPETLRPQDVQELTAVLTQLLALLSGSSQDAPEDKDSHVAEILTPAA